MRFTGWRDAGLDAAVSLLENDEAAQLELDHEREFTESKGLQCLSFPIPDRGVPASNEDALKFLTKLSPARGTGRNVAAHCRQGIGRSGMLAAALLMRSGISASEAVDVVTKARGIAVPETSRQLDWLQDLASEYQPLMHG